MSSVRIRVDLTRTQNKIFIILSFFVTNETAVEGCSTELLFNVSTYFTYLHKTCRYKKQKSFFHISKGSSFS